MVVLGDQAWYDSGVGVVRVRKRPVEHQAILYTGRNCEDVARFLGADWDHALHTCTGDQPWSVWTLHGEVEAQPGDWIVKGERDAWPVDAEQFEATYEVVG